MNIPMIIADDTANPLSVPLGMRYVVGAGGVYAQRNTPLFVSSVKTEQPRLEGLKNVPHSVVLKTPKIPEELIRQALAFFDHIDEEYRSEAALVLLYDPFSKEFSWYCPPQDAVGMQVKFEYPLIPPDRKVVFGDFHSHPGMGPTPSGVDIQDELFRDGLHLIAGYIGYRPKKWLNGLWSDDTGGVELSATFSVDGGRVPMDPTAVVDAVPQEPFGDYPAEWFDQVTHKKWYQRQSTNWKGEQHHAYYD